jgi:glycosyltransferase involved in cell wall biosynthesis
VQYHRLDRSPCKRKLNLPRRLHRLHDRGVAISEGIGKILLAEGLPQEKQRGVHSAVELRGFDRPCNRDLPHSELGVPAQARLIGIVAQLIARKGHRLLIEALPSLVEAFPQLRVLFFGEGPLGQDLRGRVAAAGLEHHVISPCTARCRTYTRGLVSFSPRDTSSSGKKLPIS